MPAGRPTKYRKTYAQDLIEFFDHPCKVEGKPITFPTLQRFARTIGVCVDTLHEWAKVHEEFSDALTQAKEMQEAILLENAMDGAYNAQFAKFYAANAYGSRYRERQDVDLKTQASITFKIDAPGNIEDICG